jgi:general nucleoside transport system ATP-binding protein
VGSSPVAKQADSASPGPIQNARNKSVVLEVRDASAMGDRGQWALNKLTFQVQAGQLLGIAGVSGNGQKELMQALTGQRKLTQGHIKVKDQVFHGSRAENKNLAVRSLPEEPLLNACVPGMSVTQNMSLRDFDNPAYCTWGWVKWAALKSNAVQWIKAYQVKTQGEHALIESLSGGNIQRTVLARELSFAADLLLVSNPSFGLDFAATAEVHAKLRQARASGTAILLISEDLDEILQLADQVAIISEGHIVHSVDARQANRQLLGSFMAGDVHVEIAA